MKGNLNWYNDYLNSKERIGQVSKRANLARKKKKLHEQEDADYRGYPHSGDSRQKEAAMNAPKPLTLSEESVKRIKNRAKLPYDLQPKRTITQDARLEPTRQRLEREYNKRNKR